MLAEERFEKILNALEKHKSITVTAISKEFDISESTVRRDLNTLDELGKLVKVHGGAVAIEKNYTYEEPTVAAKESCFMKEKEEIAKYAASTVQKNDYIFLDAGTTTFKMIDYLTEKTATYVTNGFNHARKLANKGFKVFITGGKIKVLTEAIVGIETIDYIRKFNFTKCFLGTNGITEREGFTTHESDEGNVKSAAVKNSYITYILADHSKFGTVAPVTFSKIKNCCIITDSLPDQKYKDITIIKEVGV